MNSHVTKMAAFLSLFDNFIASMGTTFMINLSFMNSKIANIMEQLQAVGTIQTDCSDT
jgi:hypothetical protein